MEKSTNFLLNFFVSSLISDSSDGEYWDKDGGELKVELSVIEGGVEEEGEEEEERVNPFVYLDGRPDFIVLF